jgi:hypothetical protein
MQRRWLSAGSQPLPSTTVTSARAAGSRASWRTPPQRSKTSRTLRRRCSRPSDSMGSPSSGVGVCFGAGPMARAVSEDARFRGMAGVAGVYTDGAKTREGMGANFQVVIDAAREAERVWEKTGVAETIPAVAPDGGNVAMPLREAYEYYGTSRGAVPELRERVRRAVTCSPPSIRRDGGRRRHERPSHHRPFGARAAAGPRKRVPCRLRAPKKDLWLESRGRLISTTTQS